MKKEKEEFTFTNLPNEAQDPSISKDDFKLVQADEKIHDQKFETKPTTFLKDSIKRFSKNKSSVVAAFILGFLLLLSFIVPLFAGNDSVHVTDGSRSELQFLQPRLFKAGSGFWDGTKKMKNIVADTTSSNKDDWGPDKEIYNRNAVSDLKIGEETYTVTANKYAKGGYLQFGYYDNIPDSKEYEHITLATDLKLEKYKFDHDIVVSKFVTYDIARLKASSEKTKTYPQGYVEAESALYFAFIEGGVDHELLISDYTKAHDIGGEKASVNVKDLYDAYAAEKGITSKPIDEPRFEIRVNNSKNHKNSCILVQSIKIEESLVDPSGEELFSPFSFESGKDVCIRDDKTPGYWKNMTSMLYSRDTNYLLRARLCSFTYDTYAAVLGNVEEDVFWSTLYALKENNVIKMNVDPIWDSEQDKYVADPSTFEMEILKPDKCPLSKKFEAKDVIFDAYGIPEKVHCHLLKYKLTPYFLDKMPIFLMGTDEKGNDMMLLVFKGLRNSLLLGIASAAICFLFGLFWGSVSGYFGGAVDLAMERLTDILSGVPWIVVMTLVVIHLGSDFFTFMLALCLTGWIGTAATTRTQFYRFRGREYVLASRTLGASHARLITKHILPNAMGTIITSAVLMVPSVIFSEATISYLGLGFQNMESLGVVLSEKQTHLTNYPFLLIFPSVIIALVMISFNLFGNGLRDAVNPSLKGEGE